MLKQKSILLVIAIIVIVLIGIISVIILSKEKEGRAPTGPGSTEEEGVSPTREMVPEDIIVPEIDTKVEEGVAAPKTVTEAAPGVEAKFRRFEIRAENNQYNPSTVIVNRDDTVHIDFTAIDKKYDFVFPDYGMRQVAEPGETKIIEFQAVNEGKYLFYSELYGGLEGEMKGYIIVVAK